MSWVSILILGLFLPCIAGGILTILWIGIYRMCGDWGNARYLYTLLRCTIFGFQFPVFYLTWYILHGMDTERYSSLALLSQKMKIVMYIFLFIWGMGILVFGIRQLRSWRYFSRIRECCIPASAEERRILDQVCKELGIRRQISLYSGYAVGSPFICGLWNPCIYLPMNQFSSMDLEMILYHEVMHYKQKDVLWKPLFAVIHFIFWFNPLTRYLWMLMREWAEASCDAACCENRFAAKGYFSLLLRVNDMKPYHNAIGFAPMWCENNQELKWRIRCIQRFKQRSRKLPVVACLVIVALMASSVSTRAAVNGASRICEKVFWETIDRKEEAVKYMQDPEPMIQDGALIKNINWTLRSGEVNILPEFKFDSETDLYIYGNVTPDNKEILIEFVKDDQTTQYLADQNAVGHFFYAEKEGKYRMMIRNLSNEEVTFHGYIYSKRH